MAVDIIEVTGTVRYQSGSLKLYSLKVDQVHRGAGETCYVLLKEMEALVVVQGDEWGLGDGQTIHLAV